MRKEFARIAIRVGSNILTRQDGVLDITRTSALIGQIAALHKAGMGIVLISSGVVASERNEIRTFRKLNSTDQHQLSSVVGQARLINRYYELFHDHGIAVGQILTTKENFGARRHCLNQKNCMAVILENGIIPIVNENDTISVTELTFTDSDELSGLIASIMDAQTLIILSNIDDIYNGSPTDLASSMIRGIGQERGLTNYIQTSKSDFRRGGMLAKTNIARRVANEGIAVVITNGERDNILINLTEHPEETICTRFTSAPQPVSNIKKWIAHSEGFAKGEIHINEQASEVLNSNKAVSILPIGITHTGEEFEKGDIMRIIDNRGVPIGVGKASCDSTRTRDTVGKYGKKTVVHYDYLYIE